MAKVKSASSPPKELRMGLFKPGMTLLHRAGLGGLACTLRYIERAFEDFTLSEDDLPGWPWAEGRPPWVIGPTEAVLDFGGPGGVASFLENLFRIAFGLKDGLMYLPGQYAAVEPNQAVRADLQAGLTLTFLQHGR